MRMNAITAFTLFLFMTAVIISTSAVAQFDEERLDELAELYNENIEHVPGVIRSVIASETINVHINEDTITHAFGVQTHKGRIIATQNEHFSSPTLNIFADQETLDRILASEDPVSEILHSWGRDIQYDAVGIYRTAKVAVGSLGLRFARWLTLV